MSGRATSARPVLAIMQPYFFPYIDYFRLAASVDRFVFLDDVQYIRRGWINRNRLLIRGEPSYFSVPVKKPARSDRICDVRIAEPDERERILETIRHTYRKAPFFDQTFTLARRVLSFPTNFIGELAKHSVQEVCRLLRLETSFVQSSRIYGNDHLRGEARIVDIARIEGAGVYRNARGGAHLYSRPVFEAEAIDLQFLDTRSFSYSQANEVGVADLSILDVLMWVSVDAVGAFVREARSE